MGTEITIEPVPSEVHLGRDALGRPADGWVHLSNLQAWPEAHQLRVELDVWNTSDYAYAAGEVLFVLSVYGPADGTGVDTGNGVPAPRTNYTEHYSTVVFEPGATGNYVIATLPFTDGMYRVDVDAQDARTRESLGIRPEGVWVTQVDGNAPGEANVGRHHGEPHGVRIAITDVEHLQQNADGTHAYGVLYLLSMENPEWRYTGEAPTWFSGSVVASRDNARVAEAQWAENPLGTENLEPERKQRVQLNLPAGEGAWDLMVDMGSGKSRIEARASFTVDAAGSVTGIRKA
jgi:nitrogen fixation protein FixH